MSLRTLFIPLSIFHIWWLLTTVMLLTPGDTIRQVNEGMKDHSAKTTQTRSAIYKMVQDEENWHAGLFFVLGIFAVLQLKTHRRFRFVVLILLFSSFGLLIELIQEFFIPGRAFEWGDLVMNEMGLMIGLIISVVGKQVLSQIGSSDSQIKLDISKC